MPFANNQGVRIHYEVIGDGPALVLHHLAFGSGADWTDLGYVDALKANHRLIILDSRGHGQSDKPHDPAAYDLALRASDVLAVLDELNVREADYFGYSLGGWIGFELAKSAPDRFSSYVFGGAHPYAEDMQAFRNLLPRDPQSFARVIDQLSKGGMPTTMRSRWLANDIEALRALTQDRASNAGVLPAMTTPCLLFVGEDDPRLPKVRKCASALSNATFASLPGCDHLTAFARSNLVLPHVEAFLSKDGLPATGR
jgi:pimeloyl-ACP methyl ester carboxylesterase